MELVVPESKWATSIKHGCEIEPYSWVSFPTDTLHTSASRRVTTHVLILAAPAHAEKRAIWLHPIR